MKKIGFVLVLTSLVLIGAWAQTSQAAAELTFTYVRQTGPGSNQFAVWIEDANGKYIKTVYATKYTAKGGWKVRAMSIPEWVKKSALAKMTGNQVDALTSATPKAGALTYTWDGADSGGKIVPAGDYVLIFEATLRMENQVYYRAPISLGKGSAPVQVSVEYVGDGAKAERAMISDVKVRTLR